MRSRVAIVVCVVAAAVLFAAGFVFWRLAPRAVTVTTGQFPEELVYVRSSDDVVNGGAMFKAPKAVAKPIAIVWMHGWGVTSDEAKDISAWMDFVARQGFARVVLVGHSAGWATVRAYQAAAQDPRVVGLVLASGQARGGSSATDPQLLTQATKLIADGGGEDLLRLPNRSFPSFVSAATYADLAKVPTGMLDFFGERTPNPGITRISCPILAFFGTRESDVGTEADLAVLKSSADRQRTHPRVTTAMIGGADHMYAGEEAQVAQVIATWADSLQIRADSSSTRLDPWPTR